ncbi:MAG TPA: threonine synthase [Sphingobacteriaceae bacterium]|nr:threonine synthase [Sphingobacteriaceae bacterium]
MKLYSTNNKSLQVPFKEAVFNSLPVDKGLYMPEVIPALDEEFIQNLPQLSLQEIALKVAGNLIGNSIPPSDLKGIIDDAINFDAPLVPLKDGTSVLELFHGPSLAFKDFGARFMSRIMGYFSAKEDRVLDILVATSGDTGGAVALGFLGVPNTRVTILYPKGKVSEIQELQLCTNAQNIRALEIDGTFDDCQALVKQAFNDSEVNGKLRLTSANSINIARLIPQSFYYFHAYGQAIKEGHTEVVFSVPSGNFGNIGAGLLAYKMGLPVKQFLAATNANDVVPRYLESGEYDPRPSLQTISNAMDVGNPSNWVRVLDLFNQDDNALKNILTAYSFSDEQTREAIEEIDKANDYIACPHTAIAWLASKSYKNEDKGDYASVFLSTAHPCKFPSVYSEELTSKISIPEQVTAMAGREQSKISLDKTYDSFKGFLLENL